MRFSPKCRIKNYSFLVKFFFHFYFWKFKDTVLTAKFLPCLLYCLRPFFQRHQCGLLPRHVRVTLAACGNVEYHYSPPSATYVPLSRPGLPYDLVPASALLRSICKTNKNMFICMLFQIHCSPFITHLIITWIWIYSHFVTPKFLYNIWNLPRSFRKMTMK